MAVADSSVNYDVKLPKYVESKSFAMGLAEKPSAAGKIAKILDPKVKEVKIKVTRKNGDKEERLPDPTGYFLKVDDSYMMIVSAAGHLYTLTQDGVGWQYPVYDFRWVPNHIKSSNRHISKNDLRNEASIEAIKYIAHKAKDFIVMTDYDEEGEVIGGIILSQILGDEVLQDAKRMKFSTITKKEIKHSLEEALDGNQINFGMYNRGLMRHYLDWLWGINLSRALMLSLKNTSGQYLTLSTGRVQGPTLSFVSERQLEIDSFVPTPYFNINLSIEADVVWDLNYTGGPIDVRQDAISVVDKTKEQDALVAEIISKKRKKKPPAPFNLSKLQDMSHRYFKLTSQRTLQSAQRLYIAGAISYPRTSSQKYPEEIDHNEILQNLAKNSTYKKIATKLANQKNKKPVEGKKTDPAHPCIYPTGTKPDDLSGNDKKVYDLIVHTYFATFGEPAVIENNRINFDINSEDFYISGKRTVKPGWKALAGDYTGTGDKELPNFKEGETYPVKNVEWIETFTRSPPYYNDNSLRKRMEEEEIGTKATRGDIIASLFKRKYIKGKAIEITPVGEIVNQVLQNYSSQVISVQLSRQLEKMGDLVEESINEQTDEFSLADAIVQGVILLHEMLESLQDNEEEVGNLISKELQSQRRSAREVGPCQECGVGTLKIIRSTTSGKRFVGCTEYFNDKNCTATYPLPQSGRLETMDEKCKADGFPQIQVYPSGKRPWTLCLFPDCPIRAEYEKKKKKREEKKAKKEQKEMEVEN